jgi:CHAT domain-containing protein
VTDPSAGHLRLHDGPFSIGEISAMRLGEAELAFLSSCETSRGGAGLTDEAITLATAFQLAGYRHVIGTLWPISDRLAPAVANDVYEALTQPDNCGIHANNTATALDAAVLTLRHKRPGAPWLWAPYIHIGP